MSRLVVIALAGLLGTGLAASAGAGAGAPPRYVAARDDVAKDGRAIAALVRAGNGKAIVARFSPELARAVPRATVDDVLRKTLGAAPIGARLGESVVPAARDRRIYLADHRWGTRTLAIEMSFGKGGALTGIQVRPDPRVPDKIAAGLDSRSRRCSAAPTKRLGAGRPTRRAARVARPELRLRTTSCLPGRRLVTDPDRRHQLPTRRQRRVRAGTRERVVHQQLWVLEGSSSALAAGIDRLSLYAGDRLG